MAKDNGWSDACLGNDEHLDEPGWAYNKVVLKGHGSIIEDNALVGKTIGICTWNNLPYVASDYLDMGSRSRLEGRASHQIDNIIIIRTTEIRPSRPSRIRWSPTIQ